MPTFTITHHSGTSDHIHITSTGTTSFATWVIPDTGDHPAGNPDPRAEKRAKAQARLDRIKAAKTATAEAIAAFLTTIGRMQPRSLIDGGRVGYDLPPKPKLLPQAPMVQKPIQKKVKPIELDP